MHGRPGGFSILDLLLVVVVTALLALLALPLIHSAMDESRKSAIKADLRRFATFQADYYYEVGQYADASALEDFTFSSGVHDIALFADSERWIAAFTHEATNYECTLTAGTGPYANRRIYCQRDLVNFTANPEEPTPGDDVFFDATPGMTEFAGQFASADRPALRSAGLGDPQVFEAPEVDPVEHRDVVHVRWDVGDKATYEGSPDDFARFTHSFDDEDMGPVRVHLTLFRADGVVARGERVLFGETDEGGVEHTLSLETLGEGPFAPGEAVAFEALLEPSAPGAQYLWSFDDGSATAWGGPSPTHTYAEPGIYTVTSHAYIDDHEEAASSLTLTVGRSPKAEFQLLDDPSKAGESVILDASPTEHPDGTPITHFEWTLGDGAEATGEVASHVYTDPGEYGITLEVRDELGREDEAYHVITILEEAPPDEPYQGCGHGFWRQPHHFDDWPASYHPDTSFEEAFSNGIFDDKTLHQVLTQGGGGFARLGRFAVSALLNAAQPGVSFASDEEVVVDIFNEIVDEGDPNGSAFHELRDQVQQDCPLH